MLVFSPRDIDEVYAGLTSDIDKIRLGRSYSFDL